MVVIPKFKTLAEVNRFRRRTLVNKALTPLQKLYAVFYADPERVKAKDPDLYYALQNFFDSEKSKKEV